MMKTIYPALFTCLLLMLSSVVSAADQDWRLDKTSNGIQVFSRPKAGSEIREVRATATIAANLPTVLAVIDDVPNTHKLAAVIKTSELHQKNSDSDYLYYLYMAMPWPVTDRDTLMQRTISQDSASQVVTVSDVATLDILPIKKKVVRITESYQRWYLTPNNDDTVNIEMVLHSDPAGPIPGWLINALSVNTPIETLENVRTFAAEEKYRSAKPAVLSSNSH